MKLFNRLKYSTSAATLVAAVAIAGSPVALANEIELGISNELIELNLEQGYRDDFSGRFGLMFADEDDLGSKQLSYRFVTEDRVDQFDVQLGAQLYWLDVEDEDGFGVSLGVAAARQLDGKLGLAGSIYYGPDILTVGDFENTLELDLKLNYQLLENGALFLGYRSYEAETDDDDFDVYDDFYLGVRFSY